MPYPATILHHRRIYVGTDAKRMRIFFTVELHQQTRDGEIEFTMCAERLTANGSMRDGGQCCDRLLDEVVNFKEVSQEQARRMVIVWKRWHLNGMKAGCQHQRSQKWDRRRIKQGSNKGKRAASFYPPVAVEMPIPEEGEGEKKTYTYYKICNDRQDSEGLLCKPCPTCGYRYGTAWLTEPLPEAIIEEVKTW